MWLGMSALAPESGEQQMKAQVVRSLLPTGETYTGLTVPASAPASGSAGQLRSEPVGENYVSVWSDSFSNK